MKRFGLQINRFDLCCALIFLYFSLASISFLQAETRILGSTTVKIMPGTTMTTMDNLLLDGGVLNNQGTMVIKGNLVNNNTSMSNLGTGTFVFSGTTHQTISGPNQFKNFEINNSNGVKIIKGPTEIDSILTLTNGLLSLDSCTLLLGPHAVPVLTNPVTPAGWIRADSTGQLKKIFTAAGIFRFPVGDSTGTTADYSPVFLTFTGGTFNSATYAGVNLRNRKYNDPNLTGDYLKRYWNVTTNVVSPVCNATWHYVNADVQGTPTAIYGLRISPLTTYSLANAAGDSLTTSGVTSLSTNSTAFTGAHSALNSGLIVYLQGPYNTGTHQMNTALKTANLIPHHHPYTGAPWNYAPDDSVHVVPANMVDWVIIELRQSDTIQNAKTTGPRRAALLMSNGSVVDTDGVSPVRFYNLTVTQKLYPIVWHRNHMPVISAHSVPLNISGTYEYDYSTGSGQVYGGTNGCKQIDTSPVRWGMMGADANNDGSIFTNDYTDFWVPTFGTTTSYQRADFSLDGSVLINDYTDLWVPNFGFTNPLPHP